VCLLLRTYYKAVRGGGRRRVDDMCYDRRRAEACVDESGRSDILVIAALSFSGGTHVQKLGTLVGVAIRSRVDFHRLPRRSLPASTLPSPRPCHYALFLQEHHTCHSGRARNHRVISASVHGDRGTLAAGDVGAGSAWAMWRAVLRADQPEAPNCRHSAAPAAHRAPPHVRQ